MSSNWHRRSMPEYSPGSSYSTPQGGSNGRLASSEHAQYPNASPQSPYPAALVQQYPSHQYQYSQSPIWPNGDEFSSKSSQPQIPTGSSFDLGELQDLSRPLHDQPWTAGSTGRSVQGVRQQQQQGQQYFQQYLSYAPQAPKAHTIANERVYSNFERLQVAPGGTPVHSLRDSGFESVSNSPQDLPSHTQEIYEFVAGERPAFAASAPLHPPPRGAVSESGFPNREEPPRRKRTKPGLPPCSACGKALKNPSDSRKHELQHTKPFNCQVPTCSGKGFATKNDLERHKKSVHGANPSVGKGTGYICQACSPGSPSSAQKWWPRLDNFKAHILRKHKQCDMSQLIEISEAPRPDHAMSDAGYGSLPPPTEATDDQAYQHDLTGPFEMSMSRQGSYQNDLAVFGGHGQLDTTLVGVGEGPFGDQFGTNRGSISYQNESTTGLSVLYGAALQLASPKDLMMASPGIHRGSVPDIQVSDEFGFSELQPTVSAPPWGGPPPKPTKSTWTPRQASSLDNHDNLNANRTEDGDYACPSPGCNKVKRRECDLRKHMKRHTRPYGCTFPNCYKRFGSRNDWKRHENSQHFLQEMWRCEMKTGNGETCGKLICQEETFVNHLQRRHHLVAKSAEVQEHCKTMHLGREGHHHFWCGFCGKLVAQPNNPQQDSIQQSAWALRSKHIGDHFDKNNRHIHDWICIEHNKRKELITKEDKKKAKTRVRNGKADDGSDLGDDGIPATLVPSYSGFDSNVSTGHVSNMGANANIDASGDRKMEDAGDDDDDDDDDDNDYDDDDADGVSDSGW